MLLGGAASLVAAGTVKVKMLPFDNKAEFQVQLDMPAGTPREDAFVVGQALARRVLEEPEVLDVQVYAGVAAPFTFVGMVRHSFFRDAPEQVDLQVNLVPKGKRKAQSRAIVMRLRPALEAIAGAKGGRLKLVEIPPGPPVLDTLVAEIYGPSVAERDRLARETLAAFRSTAGVVDIDSTLNPTTPKISIDIDHEKSALHGVAPAAVVQTLAAAGYGAQHGLFHGGHGANQIPIILQLAPAQRSRIDQLLQLTVPGVRGPVPLSELVHSTTGFADPDIFHKNLMPVSYVFGGLRRGSQLGASQLPPGTCEGAVAPGGIGSRTGIAPFDLAMLMRSTDEDASARKTKPDGCRTPRSEPLMPLERSRSSRR